MVSVTQYAAVFASGLLLFYLTRRWPGRTAFVAVALTALLDCLQVGTSALTLGVTLYPGDAAGAILLMAGVLALLRYHKGVPRDAIPCLVLLALVALSFGRGVATFGLKPAGNSARNLFMFTMPAVSVMLLKPVFRLDAGRLARWLFCAGGVLCVIATLRWVGMLPMPAEAEESLRAVVRAIPADYANVIGLAFIGAVYLQIAGRPTTWGWLAAAVFGVVTILLQHRSVWVATAAGVGWLGVRTARSSARRWFAVATAGAVALVVTVLANPEIMRKAELLAVVNVQEVQGDRSTWAWRVLGYKEAADRLFNSGMTDMLIGPPAGWGVNSTGSFASINIHSRYIDTLAYYGLFGFTALLVWFWMLAKRLRRAVPASPVRDHAGDTLLQALMVSEVVYLIPYFGGILQGAFFGLIWVAANQNRFFIGTTSLSLDACELGYRNDPAGLIS